MAAEIEAGGGSAQVLAADLVAPGGLDRVCNRIRRGRVRPFGQTTPASACTDGVTETDKIREREMIRLNVEAPSSSPGRHCHR